MENFKSFGSTEASFSKSSFVVLFAVLVVLPPAFTWLEELILAEEESRSCLETVEGVDDEDAIAGAEMVSEVTNRSTW